MHWFSTTLAAAQTSSRTLCDSSGRSELRTALRRSRDAREDLRAAPPAARGQPENRLLHHQGRSPDSLQHFGQGSAGGNRGGTLYPSEARAFQSDIQLGVSETFDSPAHG